MPQTTSTRDRTWILLHHIEGPINLGQICRAMANTGFTNLRYSGTLAGQDPLAQRFAVHAGSLLDGARVCPDLESLTAGMDVVFGFTPRTPWKDGRDLSLSDWLIRMQALAERQASVGLLFGNEAHGLTNEDLAQCHFRVNLPSHDRYRSMNLAQAVMVALWELHRQIDDSAGSESEAPVMAGPEAKGHLLAKVRRFMDEMDFLDAQEPERLWHEFVPIFKTRDWSKRELQLLLALFSKGASRYQALNQQLATNPNDSKEEKGRG